MGIKDYMADKNLIAASLHGNHEVFTRIIDTGGRFVALISEGPEFIWGDGFLHNFVASSVPPLSPLCIVPILPTATVLFTKRHSFCVQPELVIMRLGKDEVAFFNEIVQIYSRNYIFFRKDKPQITEHFATHEHLEFEYHSHEWLDCLIESAASFFPAH